MRKPTTQTTKFWVLTGHYHGMPCAIARGATVPPFAAWLLIDETQWRELRRDRFYTRRGQRPTAYVDREFQRQVPPDHYTAEAVD